MVEILKLGNKTAVIDGKNIKLFKGNNLLKIVYYGEYEKFDKPLTPPRFSKALRFDGNDYVHVESLSPIQNKSIKEFTFGVWAKYLRDTGDIQQIFEGHTKTGEIYMEGDFPSLNFVIFDDDGNSHKVSTTLAKDFYDWYFIVGTYDGYTQKLFIDGELVASTSWSGTLTITTGITLGKDYENDIQYFDGLISSVFMYSRALREWEIKLLYYNPYDPLDWEHLTLWLTPASIDTANGIWKDMSEKGNNGKIYGATEVQLT